MQHEDEDFRQVFVVHGRDERARRGLFEFLRSIGLQPLEWGHALETTRKGSPFIGEVLDDAFRHVRAIVVLFTGDDLAMLAAEFQAADDPGPEKRLTPQARPNVLFEAGLALGRLPAATILVQMGQGLRPFSDIAGRHVIRLDNAVASRQELANRLKTVGCPVNLRGTDWHTTGNLVPTPIGPGGFPQPSTSRAVGLHPHGLAILKFLEHQEDANSTTHFTADDIALAISISITRAKHHLAQLEDKELISCSYYVGSDTEHSISREGRAYLIETGELP